MAHMYKPEIRYSDDPDTVKDGKFIEFELQLFSLLNQAHAGHSVCTWFIEITFMQASMCLCPSLRS